MSGEGKKQENYHERGAGLAGGTTSLNPPRMRQSLLICNRSHDKRTLSPGGHKLEGITRIGGSIKEAKRRILRARRRLSLQVVFHNVLNSKKLETRCNIPFLTGEFKCLHSLKG